MSARSTPKQKPPARRKTESSDYAALDVTRGDTGTAWVVWEPLTTRYPPTVVLGVAVLTGNRGPVASATRSRQLDAMLTMLDERMAALSRGLE